LFAKDLEMPIPLEQAEALKSRISENHIMRPEIEGKIRVLRSGYNGEKTINYYLGLIPIKKYLIFHDLRLPVGETFFQIDALLLSSKSIIILDGKNHAGALIFEKNQMIQEFNETKEVYENPISQSLRHKILLKYLFEQYQIPPIPIEYFVVVCRVSTLIKISPGYREAEERVCRAYDLLKKIEEVEKLHNKECINSRTAEKVKKLFLTKHTPKRSDFLKIFGIHESEIYTGVHCPNCSFIPMNYKRKSWICPKCQFISHDAHLKAINDYFLLIKTSTTNKEILRFLHLPSPRSTRYLLSLIKLPYTGNKRARVYHQPQSFPLNANHVFPKPYKQ
jgi:Nuclease-related domain